MNNSLALKMAENYSTPHINPAPMNPHHLSQLSISRAPVMMPISQQPSMTIV